METEQLQYDVVIVGAGPAGLATAIRLHQLSQQTEKVLTVCVVEKAASVGAHILSGAVIEPRALNELLPNWQELSPPAYQAVSKELFLLLSETRAFNLPVPASMNNHGNFIVSLGQFCQWLGEYAENLGIDIFPGFAASRCLFDKDGAVCGIQTGDMGREKNGEPGAQFEPGVEIRAKYTIFAEGCRGHLSQQLIKKYGLSEQSQPQTYGIGLKELWQVDNKFYQPGLVIHSIGWPLDKQTYGGSFLYHGANNKVALGLVVGLDYQNPYLSPYDELQTLKTHPEIKKYLAGGERISYGARALNEGGYQSIPQCHFPGGLLVGCAAGFMNVAKIKGSHTAMKSGMLAAESIFAQFDEQTNNKEKECSQYQQAIKNSWISQELYQVRNVRPGFQKGLWLGLINAAVDQYVFRGKAPWTYSHHADHLQLKPASENLKIDYPKADGTLTFDKMTSLSFSNVYHEENQPCHLQLQDDTVPIKINLAEYAALETRYCPAGVYEIVETDAGARLQINGQNCIHCKTCDIKDPKQNITWTTPEGGGGPNYSDM